MRAATGAVRATIEFGATLGLNEEEIRALAALVGYGDNAFLEAFKERLGAAYIENHEQGLRSAFSAIRRDLLPALGEIDRARRDLKEAILKRLRTEQAAALAREEQF